MNIMLDDKTVYKIGMGDVIITKTREKFVVIVSEEKLTIFNPTDCSFKQYDSIKQLKEEYGTFKLIHYNQMEDENHEYTC